GRVQSWNQGAQRIKGYSAQEIIGQHFSKFYPEEDILGRKPSRELEEASKYGRVRDEGWRVRKDGTRFWGLVAITAVRNSSGQLQGYVKITRDLTQRREMEEEIRRFNQDLEQRVHDRTVDLSRANEARLQLEQ